MWLAIEAVKRAKPTARSSAGNTGALMAMAKFCLRTCRRSIVPRSRRSGRRCAANSIVLDVGATIGADAQQLVDLAIMGAAMARIVFRHRTAHRRPAQRRRRGDQRARGGQGGRPDPARDQPSPLIYHGFVEGDDLGKGTVDVVVTEGFTGNIALKTAEGTAKQIGQYLRDAMITAHARRIGYFFARGAFAALRAKMDPGAVNGGVFLGLDGVVIKSSRRRRRGLRRRHRNRP